MLFLSKRSSGAPSVAESAIDYILVSSQAGAVTSYSNTFTGLPTPLAGQRPHLLVMSKLAPASCSLAGSAANQLAQANIGSGAAFATLYDQTGWEDDELAVAVTFGGGGSAFMVLHGWRTLGWEYDASSLIGQFASASGTGGLTLSMTKPLNGVSCLGGRHQRDPSGATVTEDFDSGAAAWAGRIMTAAALTGDIVFTGPVSAQVNRMCAAFDLVPE